MAKRRWKPREIRRVLMKLGFIEKPGRGKGDHRMYFKTVSTADGGTITLVTMLDMGSDIVSAKSLQAVLSDTVLDMNELEDAFRGHYTVSEYEAHLRNCTKAELLSKSFKKGSR